jgi:hypothetical protein
LEAPLWTWETVAVDQLSAGRRMSLERLSERKRPGPVLSFGPLSSRPSLSRERVTGQFIRSSGAWLLAIVIATVFRKRYRGFTLGGPRCPDLRHEIAPHTISYQRGTDGLSSIFRRFDEPISFSAFHRRFLSLLGNRLMRRPCPKRIDLRQRLFPPRRWAHHQCPLALNAVIEIPNRAVRVSISTVPGSSPLLSERFTAAKLALNKLHRELMDFNPSAARSLAEGMEETLMAHKLQVPPQLRQTLASTNVIESAFSVVERVCANVKRWHPGDQRERWVGSGLLVAEKQFRRVRGH